MEKQRHILVVDDDEFALQSMADVLKEESYQVVTAAGGSEALDLLLQGSFDLVLTDLKMPEVDGLEVLKRAREIAPQAVVLILTGYAALESAIEALREGAYDYLLKPCSSDELRLKIERGLEVVRLVEERQRAEEALRNTQEQLALITDNIPALIAYVDSEQRYLHVNQPYADWYGYSKGELVGKHVRDVLYEESHQGAIKHIQAVLQGQEVSFKNISYDLDGQIRAVRAAYVPHFDEAGHVKAFFALVQDITERVRAEREIEERQMYLEGVLRDAPDAIVTLDARHRIVEWNAGAERLFGYPREEAVGQDIDHLVTNPDVFEDAVGFTQIAMSGREVPPTETVRYRKDGSPVDVLLAGSPILVGDELIGTVVVYTDITQRMRVEEALRALALVDELTGLYNRRGFVTLAEQQLKTANRAKRRMMLLFADFDGLKQINDTFGHPEGDRALINVADALRETFRESDIIARIAGDEFVVLAIETDRVSSEVLATRLQENLEARNARGDRRYKLSLSVGIARYDPERPCSIDELLAQADRAMYEHKRGAQRI